MNYNDKIYQIFTLGEFPYLAPKKIGAGIQSKYRQALMQSMLDSKHSKEILEFIADVAVKSSRPSDPRIQVDEELEKKHRQEKLLNASEGYESAVKAFYISSQYDYRLVLLQSILEPFEDSPTVKEAFDIATEEEVARIENFFNKKLPTITSEEHTMQDVSN